MELFFDYGNIVKSVSSRESGCSNKIHFQTEVARSKLKNLFEIGSKRMENETGMYCRYLKRTSHNSVVAVGWKKSLINFSERHENSIYKIHFIENDNHGVDIIEDISYDVPVCIDDIIELSTGIFYCGTLLNNYSYISLVIHKYFDENRPCNIIAVNDRVNVLADNFGNLALGFESGDVMMFGRENSRRELTFQGKVTSLEINQKGSILYVGCKKMFAVDIRDKTDNKNELNIGKKNPKDLKLLSDQVSLLVADEKITKLDLRMNRTVFEYPHHIDYTDRKRTFDVDEEFDILCATGRDNSTKLWSLSTGKLLRNITPQYKDKHGMAHSCLARTKLSWSVNIIEGGVITCYSS